MKVTLQGNEASVTKTVTREEKRREEENQYLPGFARFLGCVAQERPEGGQGESAWRHGGRPVRNRCQRRCRRHAHRIGLKRSANVGRRTAASSSRLPSSIMNNRRWEGAEASADAANDYLKGAINL
jgi:hypothetical protein